MFNSEGFVRIPKSKPVHLDLEKLFSLSVSMTQNDDQSAIVKVEKLEDLDDTRWRGELPEGRGLDHEVAEAIVRAVTRQERRRARPELFAYARLQLAEMVGRHDLH